MYVFRLINVDAPVPPYGREVVRVCGYRFHRRTLYQNFRWLVMKNRLTEKAWTHVRTADHALTSGGVVPHPVECRWRCADRKRNRHLPVDSVQHVAERPERLDVERFRHVNAVDVAT